MKVETVAEMEPTEHASSSLEFEALQSVIGALGALEPQARRRILESAATFLEIDVVTRGLSPRFATGGESLPRSTPLARFSEDTSISPKDFLLEKQPRTDVERIACLAYYLTHYRETPHFKTVDLSMVNTEAAQPKFANAAYAANNAVKMGYLVPATKGQRQLSAVGERFVLALPDREAAKEALNTLRRRSRSKRNRGKSGDSTEA